MKAENKTRARTPNGKNRAIPSVNRELEVMRAVMRFAVRSGWIIISPFETGDDTDASDEDQRLYSNPRRATD